MGLTVSNLTPIKFSNRRGAVADVTFDNSYPTDGEVLTPKQLGLNVIDYITVENIETYIFVYNRTNQKLKALTALGTEVTSGTNLSAVTVRVFAVGW
jgi:hypothetical protein